MRPTHWVAAGFEGRTLHSTQRARAARGDGCGPLRFWTRLLRGAIGSHGVIRFSAAFGSLLLREASTQGAPAGRFATALLRQDTGDAGEALPADDAVIVLQHLSVVQHGAPDGLLHYHRQPFDGAGQTLAAGVRAVRDDLQLGSKRHSCSATEARRQRRPSL
eukprot:scaffold1272_cov250-Pinguiococcus_pyrenoidosus.AAC.54